VNLVNERREVISDARPNATYQDEVALRRGGTTNFAARPGLVVALVEML
jgi:hypothetical protein